MAIKSDRWIKKMAAKGMIEPFVERQVRDDVVSYGLSSYGYDIRVADEFKVFGRLAARLALGAIAGLLVTPLRVFAASEHAQGG